MSERTTIKRGAWPQRHAPFITVPEKPTSPPLDDYFAAMDAAQAEEDILDDGDPFNERGRQWTTVT